MVIVNAQNPVQTSSESENKKNKICFALYTVHENILKLTAQFYPIKDYHPFTAELQIKEDGKWKTVLESRIEYLGYSLAPY